VGRVSTNIHVEEIPNLCQLMVFANRWRCALRWDWRNNVATIVWSLEGITSECVNSVLPKDDEQHYVNYQQLYRTIHAPSSNSFGENTSPQYGDALIHLSVHVFMLALLCLLFEIPLFWFIGACPIKL
jgi:hypothetical protein